MDQYLIRLGSLFWNCAHLPGLIDLSPKAALNVECHPNEYVPSLQVQPAHRQAYCSRTESTWCVLFDCLSFPEVSGIFYEHKIALGIFNLQESFIVIEADSSFCLFSYISILYKYVCCFSGIQLAFIIKVTTSFWKDTQFLLIF